MEEVDKFKSISQMTMPELQQLLTRLNYEADAERLIRELKISAGERSTEDQPFMIDTTTPVNALYHMDFSTEQRKELAKKGQAMPDGSYPIRNSADLRRAIQAFGRAGNQAAVKQWIKKRAKELKLENSLPDSWKEVTQSSLDNEENFLSHHGVLGMRWGIRKDRGSSNASKSTSKTESSPKPTENYTESRVLKSKTIKELSNEDLKKLNERLNLEKQYKDLTKQEVNKGKTFVNDALTTGLKQTATTLVAAASLYAVKRVIENKYGTDVVSSMFPKKK